MLRKASPESKSIGKTMTIEKGDLFRFKSEVYHNDLFIILGKKEDLPYVDGKYGEPFKYLVLETSEEGWDYSSFIFEQAEKIG
jgi:hypothetical protein